MIRALAMAALIVLAACSRAEVEEFAFNLTGNLLSNLCEGDDRCDRVCPDGSPTDRSRPVCPTPAWLD